MGTCGCTAVAALTVEQVKPAPGSPCRTRRARLPRSSCDAWAVITLFVIAAGGLVASIFSRRWRRGFLRVLGMGAVGIVAVYLVGRGIAEFWVVDYSNSASYQNSWGGPHLAGVFAVHSGPGAVILVVAGVYAYRRWKRMRSVTPG